MKQRFDKKHFLIDIVNNWKSELNLIFDHFENFDKYGKPKYITLKTDGELNGLYFDGNNVELATKSGRIRTDLPVTEEIKKLLNNKVKNFIGITELYVKIDDKVMTYTKASSILRNPQSIEDEKMINLKILDVISIDNERILKDYYDRVTLIEDLFKDGHNVQPIEIYKDIDIQKLWKDKVLSNQYEGIVAYFDEYNVKFKPVLTLDLVVIGIEISTKLENSMSNLLLAFMDQENKFRYAGRVGTGFTLEDRKRWFDIAMNKKIKQEGLIVWIKPQIIVEIEAKEAYIRETPRYDEDMNEIDSKRSALFREPSFKVIRDDKLVNPIDLRLEQIPNWIDKEANFNKFFEYEKELDYNLFRKAYYPKHPETEIVPINEYLEKPLREKDIWEYYDKVKSRIVAFYNKYDFDTLLMIKVDKVIVKRPSAIKTIEDFEKLNNGRTLEWHFSLKTDKTSLAWIDFDPKEEFSWLDLKKIVLEVKELIDSLDFIRGSQILFSGSKGFHLHCFLKKEMDIDEVRLTFKKFLNNYIENKKDNRLSIGIIKRKDGLRIDISTLHVAGGLRVPYSLSKMGLVCIPLNEKDLLKFEKEDAIIEKILKLKKNAAEDVLKEYKRKREFGKTPEPRPEIKKKINKRRWVIQYHYSKRFHGDFRLETADEKGHSYLKSWAVPKIEDLLTGRKDMVLAIETEPHPIEYIDFEGEIPQGHYGAGKVEVYDTGYIEDIQKETVNSIKVHLKGNTIDNTFVFFKPEYFKDTNKWYLRMVNMIKETSYKLAMLYYKQLINNKIDKLLDAYLIHNNINIDDKYPLKKWARSLFDKFGDPFFTKKAIVNIYSDVLEFIGNIIEDPSKHPLLTKEEIKDYVEDFLIINQISLSESEKNELITKIIDTIGTFGYIIATIRQNPGILRCSGFIINNLSKISRIDPLLEAYPEMITDAPGPYGDKFEYPKGLYSQRPQEGRKLYLLDILKSIDKLS